MPGLRLCGAASPGYLYLTDSSGGKVIKLSLCSSLLPERQQQKALGFRGNTVAADIACMWMLQCLPAAVTDSHLTWAFGRVASRCLKIVFSQMVTTHLQLPAAVTPEAQCSQALAVHMHRSGSSKGVSLPIMQAASVPSSQAVVVQSASGTVWQCSCPANRQHLCRAAALQL